MISWMQNNNRYLVVTIWIATIAFIGAGFVGWGSVSFGSSGNSVAKVGDISISNSKYSFTYNNIYAQYAQKLGKDFDKKRAKEFGLEKSVLTNLINQAYLLNFAKEFGIVVSEKEIGLTVTNFTQFKDKSGQFKKEYYDNFLNSRGLKAKEFEAILKDDATIKKLFKLINVAPQKLEKDAISTIFNIGDKIKYKLIKASEIEVKVEDSKLKSFWESRKDKYLTKTEYKLDLLWTKGKDLNLSKNDIENYYKTNSFNFVDKSGKVQELDKVKDLVKNSLILEKIKKQASIERSRFKKGKISATETLTLSDGDSKFSANIWKKIHQFKEGDFLKPSAVEASYVTIHINSIKKPIQMSFDNAKSIVTNEFINTNKSKQLEKLVKDALKNSETFNLKSDDFITMSSSKVLPNLSQQDSNIVYRTIFNSNKESDAIKISDGFLVYKIIEQKIIDNNSSNVYSDKDIANMKNSELSNNLIKKLSLKYKTEIYLKDIK